jgi:streptomycin 6-kinase
MRDTFQPWLKRWCLVAEGDPISTRAGNRLLPVRCKGEPAILKIIALEEERRGAVLMDWYGGVGAAHVLAREKDALLLERLTGSQSLAEMAAAGDDDEAVRILCETAAKLHTPRERPPPASLVPLEKWFEALKQADQAHGSLFAQSMAAARYLLNEPRQIVVLHGDLHHGNVLDGGVRGWLAIDPKGLIGERGFEFANLFRNPSNEIALEPTRMIKRATIVADVARLDPKRLLQWVVAYAGLGSAWTLEDGGDPRIGLAIAERAAFHLQQM